jgi:hypothetical protein
MIVLLTILATIAVDWGLASLLANNKNKQMERDEDLFLFKLEKTLENKDEKLDYRIEKAKHLCRMTESKMATGAYQTLDLIQKL